jgi:hypothetical protein
VSHQLLRGCSCFAALEEHARRLCAVLNIPSGQVAPVDEKLAAFAASGRLVQHRELRNCLRRTPTADPVKITTVGIPTRDRVSSLERCLASLVDGIRLGEGSPELIVVDDSMREEHRVANRGLLASLGGTHRSPLFYVGPEERDRYVRTLAARAGFDGDDVAFGLANPLGFPIATGASRNLLLLHAAGEAMLQLDDDTVCLLAPAPGARPGLVSASRHDPTEFWFPTAWEPPPGGVFMPHDLLAIHEQLLGKGLGDCLESLTGAEAPEVGRAGAGFVRQSGGQVGVTATGVAGDSGMSSSLYFLLLREASRERLNRSEAIYRGAVGGHRVARAVTRPTVVRGGVCQALNLGLDHRRPLPPFLPVQRNQDGVFAALVKACCHDTYFGFLPWMISHEPPRPRRLTDDDLVRAAVGVRSDQIVQLLIRASAPGSGGTFDQNLTAVGRALNRLAALPEERFRESVRLVVWEQMGGLARQLSDRLREYGGRPEWWAADVRRLLDALRTRLAEPDFMGPEDLRRAFGPTEALSALQQLVGRFGRLLRCWPVMVEAALDLRALGVRPGEPL